LAALERALGARLLSRTTRSLALTEDGERYFEQARRLVAEIAEAESSLRQGEQRPTGWLRVAASMGFGRLKLLPLVKTFLAANPEVKIDLRLNDGFVDLVEQGIDVAVRIGELTDSTLGGPAHRHQPARRDRQPKVLAFTAQGVEAATGAGGPPAAELHRLHRTGHTERLDLHCRAWCAGAPRSEMAGSRERLIAAHRGMSALDQGVHLCAC
jgi:DNA-binding transcriptional LysR family regulator